MAVEVLEIFGTKFSYFRECYTNSLKINCSFHLSVGVAKILSIGLSDEYTIHFCGQIFYIVNGLRVILVKPRKSMSCSTDYNLYTMAYIKNLSPRFKSTGLKTMW